MKETKYLAPPMDGSGCMQTSEWTNDRTRSERVSLLFGVEQNWNEKNEVWLTSKTFLLISLTSRVFIPRVAASTKVLLKCNNKAKRMCALFAKNARKIMRAFCSSPRKGHRWTDQSECSIPKPWNFNQNSIFQVSSEITVSIRLYPTKSNPYWFQTKRLQLVWPNFSTN